MPVVSVAEQPWRKRSQVMVEGSVKLFRRFVSGMLMLVVPGASGS
jgi:hypothetical protein